MEENKLEVVDTRDYFNVAIVEIDGEHGIPIENSPICQQGAIAYIEEFKVHRKTNKPYTKMFVSVDPPVSRQARRAAERSIEALMKAAGYKVLLVEYSKKETVTIYENKKDE